VTGQPISRVHRYELAQHCGKIGRQAIKIILILAAWWAVGGYLIGLALETIGFDAYRFGLMLAAINVIIGLVLFLFLTRDPESEALFFRGPFQNFATEARPSIGCLWILPTLVFLYGVTMWLWAVIIRLIFPEQ